MPLPPTKQPVIAHFHQPLRQDVLQKAAQKRECWQATGSQLLGLAVTIAKCDAIILDTYNAVVAERDTENIRREILQRGCTTADHTTINHPCLAPRVGRHLGIQITLPQ